MRSLKTLAILTALMVISITVVISQERYHNDGMTVISPPQKDSFNLNEYNVTTDNSGLLISSKNISVSFSPSVYFKQNGNTLLATTIATTAHWVNQSRQQILLTTFVTKYFNMTFPLTILDSVLSLNPIPGMSGSVMEYNFTTAVPRNATSSGFLQQNNYNTNSSDRNLLSNQEFKLYENFEGGNITIMWDQDLSNSLYETYSTNAGNASLDLMLDSAGLQNVQYGGSVVTISID